LPHAIPLSRPHVTSHPDRQPLMGRKPAPIARERILAAAASCCQRDGYHGASMAAVASAAGLRKANLFHSFPGKAALAAAMVARATATCRDAVRADIADGDPVAAVARPFARAVAALENDACASGCPVGGIAHAATGCDPVLRAAGRLTPDLDPSTCASALIALFQGALLQAKAAGEAAPVLAASAAALACLGPRP